MTITRTAIEGLAERVAVAGLTATSHQDLRQLAVAGSEAGVPDVVCEVLTDDSEPEVARIRAFSRVTCAVSASLASGHVLAA